jgi:hypothetical protein
MEYATLRLSDKKNHTKYFDIRFKLLDNHFVPKWIDCILEAQQKQYPISETWAMYNLNDNLNEQFVIGNLNRLIKEVDEVQHLFGLEIRDIKDQDTLNKIHAVFEEHHGKLDEWKQNPLFKGKPDSFRRNLSEINQFVHACESQNDIPKIRVVWFDLPKYKKFTDEDYRLFTNGRNFGSIYHLYSDVGKNIESLAEDNDDHHHDIVPNIHYSADVVIYFKQDSKVDVQRKDKLYKEYITMNQTYIESKGYTVDDSRLTTGRIEIARLETDLSNEELLEKIKKFNHIQSFFLS